MKRTIIRYSFKEANRIRAETERENRELVRLREQPDILETAGGYCPNYEKLEKLFKMNAEKALIWCNMD